MNVYLTFGIEVWCNGWDNPDSAFPGNFERYVFGHSHHGDYTLPDGIGRERPAQVGACSAGEMRNALLNALSAGITDFVVVSHNFKMLKPDTVEPDWIVVRRFDSLCKFLAEHRGTLPVCSYGKCTAPAAQVRELPKTTFTSTLGRYFEQLARRLG